MRSLTQALVVVACFWLSGCGRADEAAQPRTPEQQQQADKLYDMGQPTDRKKAKGY